MLNYYPIFPDTSHFFPTLFASELPSMISLCHLLIPLISLLLQVKADVPHFYLQWTISYSTISPFGLQKKVIAINDQFPGPLLNVTTNDILSLNVFNNLDEPFLLTWNGVWQRRDSWDDGVLGTDCPIPPGKNQTYNMQFKDQIGSYFYFPAIDFQKAAGGYGPIRINNRPVMYIPFAFPHGDFDILISDWCDSDYQDMRKGINTKGHSLINPRGILINGLPSGGFNLTLEPGYTYRLRISNVGIKASLNFRIQGHKMQLVETEGAYTVQNYYETLDIHVGQSYSVLVTADQTADMSYYIVASARFINSKVLYALAILNYNESARGPIPPVPTGPDTFDYNYSINQARSIRLNLTTGAARPNPQGSYHYGKINISRTIVLRTDKASIKNQNRYTVNGVSFVYPDTPLKLADYYNISNVFTPGGIPDVPDNRKVTLGTPVIVADYKSFIEIVFENTENSIQTWHMDGYNFFFVGMKAGNWNANSRLDYNKIDAIYRSTVQVYPSSWTAVLVSLDNMGMWNIRSQDPERRYLGQELYMKVKWADPYAKPSPRDENPIPSNVLHCGRCGGLS